MWDCQSLTACMIARWCRPVCAGRQYEQRLRAQHNKLNPRTAWASLKKAAKRKHAAGGGSDSDDEAAEAAERLLQRAGGLLARGAALPPSMLETTRLKDANQAAPCKGAVKCVSACILFNVPCFSCNYCSCR